MSSPDHFGKTPRQGSKLIQGERFSTALAVYPALSQDPVQVIERQPARLLSGS